MCSEVRPSPLNRSSKLLISEELMMVATRRHPSPAESPLLYGFFGIGGVAVSTTTEK